MKLFDLIRNPLVKWLGIFLVLYFAAFHNKNNPRSLGNRLSPERIKENLVEAKEKGDYIIENIKKAKELKVENSLPNPVQESGLSTTPTSQEIQPEYPDIKMAIQDKISCGTEVFARYQIYNSKQEQIYSTDNEKIIVGSQQRKIFEDAVLEMKVGDSKSIKVSKTDSAKDSKLSEMAKKHNSDLEIKIMILYLMPSIEKDKYCKENEK